MSNFYVPPQGLFFRLLGYASNHVLVSRTHQDPEVTQHNVGDVHPDQFFQLLHGTGNHAGLYAIKGRVSGKVLWSRTSPDPNIGHIDGDGKYEDNWFKLEIGTGHHASGFRLFNPSSDTVLVSRTTFAPYVTNHHSSAVYDDQYFSFLFEDMVIDRVVYHVDKGKILASVPLVIADQTLENDSDEPQTMEFSVNETQEESSTFEYALGFTITIGASGKAGIPFVAEGEISVEASNSHNFTWGTTTTNSKSYTARLPVTARPHTVVRATSSVTRSTIDIPITVYSKSVSTGLEVKTEGKYTGVTTWNLRHSVSQDDED
ncbi:hypothetical protein CVT25_002421 [Psilocybe cyanescens]|uniref:Agglutinin domain-containing protein n=1 Tax=Psilocybe cyanescens TaxID=93625 RepID=A0A409WK35_PSICY|nr:hypothetical protein CVT25_002421 [Psilocybe cyanescens]